jgi:ribosome recycling factor
MVKTIIKEVEEKMKATLSATRHELSTLRAGKANLSVLEPVKVDYYGSKVPLNQAATLSVPEPRLILVQPFDPKQIGVIERAILEANVGMTPSNDGRVIRLPVPQLTEETRKDLCKRARELGEKGKVAVRHNRHEGRSALEKREKDKEISEDERDRGYDQIQQLHDNAIEEISQSVSRKEADIMEV